VSEEKGQEEERIDRKMSVESIDNAMVASREETKLALGRKMGLLTDCWDDGG